jgi:hypothetical protein
MNQDNPTDGPRRSSRGSARDATRRRSSSFTHHEESDDHSNRILVDHSYADHLYDAEAQSDMISDTDTKNGKRHAPRGGVTVAFPERLHEMLAQMDEEGLEHIVSWQPHGRCFIVRKKKEFIEEVMPRFFHQTKLTSFQRQLNLYGFVRLTTGRDRGAYYHELFLRGRPDLCRNMIRTRVKGNGMKAASNPQNEPDFYAMKVCPKTTIVPPQRVASEQFVINSSTEEKEVLVPSPPIKKKARVRMNQEPKIVTPMCSPGRPKIHFVQPPALLSMSFLELPDPSESDDRAEVSKSPSTVSDDGLHSGDEVFFEGFKFRYLDRVDLLEDSFNTFLDHVSSTEFV